MKKPLENLPPSKIKWLEIEDFEYLCFDFTQKYMSYDEPIPDFSTRDNVLLESALGSPKQTFAEKFLYEVFSKQASLLFYSIIKNHPFKNGNKRIAVMSLLVFLSLNNRWLSIEPIDLYKLARYVAATRTIEKDQVLNKIEEKIIQYITFFPKKRRKF